ncbi:hypothetical protein M3Y97_01050500 [Aphelenchoides bicaudatus]|nr:hypothetical protein M3Y97_01050500 [Aphelenchoides bicaudatus]
MAILTTPNLRQYFFPSTHKYDRPFNFSNFNKYILMPDIKDGGRYGNVFFRVASLFGIGKQLDRIACLDRTFSDKFRSEFNTVFPNLHNYVLLENCWTDKVKSVAFHNEIWNYIYESTLEQYADEERISLNTGVLECFRFFHRFRQEIIKMFEFSVSFKQKIDKLAKEVFKDDTSPKICAHIRRSDFFGGAHPLLPTTEPFTSKALDYLVTTVSNNVKVDKVSLLLFNDDADFTNEVADQVKKNCHVKNIFMTKFKPIDDMGLAIRHCDYFLLTSSGSTFGWWMAYLLPDNKQHNVFYNSLLFKKEFEHVIRLFREEEFFPAEWNRLVWENNQIFMQDRSIPAFIV